MKKIYLTFLFALTSVIVCAQSAITKNQTENNQQPAENSVYQLFPTQNIWTFLKLNTRNGNIWQVHFSISEDGSQGELPVNTLSLVSEERQVNGRFTLYPTENIYNFLLLDQIDGQIYQVQWSTEEDKRGLVDVF
ncbi:hypothetical protein FKX85_01930 [Echinicola soli]|uniref:Uncharacterized protein n=1 Tax=Echinicola soli TaxID=2591634 RepID=A0A514CDG9_9BACT|nr:hypothetical protein [Echinicola soli]QDH77869.1 hypothetical protein FKX85_01930 [Echinicola soli]